MELGRLDDLANIRSAFSAKNHIAGWKLAKKLLAKAHKAEPLIKKFARGDLIMKYSGLKPGPQLGRKIENVKVQIVLGKIKNEKELREYLRA